MADNSDTIATNALGPKKVEGKQGSIEQHPIPDQIQAEKFRKAQSAAANPLGGIRLARVIPPSSTGPGS